MSELTDRLKYNSAFVKGAATPDNHLNADGMKVVAACMEDAVDELDRLQAELDELKGKLPKCWRLNEAGELVKDAPVVPGIRQRIWVNWQDDPEEVEVVWYQPVYTTEDTEYIGVRLLATAGDEFIEEVLLEHCFLTRTAAEAAQKKKEGEG